MNRSRLFVLVFMAVSSLGTWFLRDATLAQEKRPASTGMAWEFKLMGSDDLARLALGDAFKAKSGYELSIVENGANKLGDENWELVTTSEYGPYMHQYVFKRPKIAK